MMTNFQRNGRRLFQPSRTVAALWVLIFLQTFITPSDTGTCVFNKDDLDAICPPCDTTSWLDLIGSGRGDEKITNEDETCFNSDPISLHYGDPTGVGIDDITLTISQGEYHTTKTNRPNQLLLLKQGFFRYAYSGDGDSDPLPLGDPNPNPPDYLDIDGMKKYYDRTMGNGARIVADFQLLEWPGRTAELQVEIRKEAAKAKRAETCTTPVDLKDSTSCDPPNFFMLNFKRDNGKIQFYPCNSREGTNIVAVGSLAKVNKSEIDWDVESPQKIWLSHGRKSIYNHYIEPMFLPTDILDQMAKDEGERCKKGDDYRDLRTVLDFAFTSNRLILGMECGIVMVSGLDTEDLVYNVSMLRDESGSGTNLFPDPVNKISASTCCFSEKCSSDLVAAYSFQPDRTLDQNRFLYISFNLGHDFEKKIIASPHSPMNLIKGLYQLYQKWRDYYEILNESSDEDKEEDDKAIRKLRKKNIWDVVATDEKERLFSFGVVRAEKKKSSLKKIVEIFENRVPKRKERLRNAGVDIDTDKSPDWVNFRINTRRNKAGWQEDWTDETCEHKPECKKRFENDTAVKWLLGDAGISVMTPKRLDNEPFCKEITSILVLPEERNVMALCYIGHGNSEEPIPIAVTTTSKPPTDEMMTTGESSPSAATRKTTTTSSTTTSSPSGSSGTNGPNNVGEGGNQVQYFALFNFAVKKYQPIVHSTRVSQRIISCKLIKNDLTSGEEFFVQPELVRIPGSSTIFIINCEGVIFLTTNFGNTLFNAAFYYRKDVIDQYCDDTNMKTPEYAAEVNEDVEGCQDKKTSLTPVYLRSFYLCALNVPPIIIADGSATILTMTFGRFYASGAIAYNRESRFVVGETLKDLHIGTNRQFENVVFPGIDSAGAAILAAALKKIYSIPSTMFGDDLYKDKPSIRLVKLPFKFHNEIRNFQTENLAMCSQVLNKNIGFSVCKTISFFVHPKRVAMDINEHDEVSVHVKDDDPDLPLWVFSSNEKSVEVKVVHSNNKTDLLNSHNWIVEINSKPNKKSETESLVDSFYGSDYNRINDFSTQVALVNTPSARCHVQPSSTVNVEIGCEKKRLIAHEERHRPQCAKFRENFKYILKKGTFDPDLAAYWIHRERFNKKPFVKLLPEGNLEVTFDYSSWGCPIEPYRSDPFIPDLRILNESNKNSTVAPQFAGKFILIELFGAKHYNYTQKVKDIKRCKRPPQTLSQQLKDWIVRQRLFYIAAFRLKFPFSATDLDSLADINKDITGNKILSNEAVKEHINIWNRANYLSCEEDYENDENEEGDQDDPDPGSPRRSNKPLSEDVLERQYEIMMTKKIEEDEEDDEANYEHLEAHEFDEVEPQDGDTDQVLNTIIWSKRDHQRVYLFLAVAVDEYDSLCEYQTVFAVSLGKQGEMNNLTSFLVFFLFLFLWAAIIIGGYFVRKRMLRYSLMRQRKADKLEQAAWLIVYRYEKLAHSSSSLNMSDRFGETDSERRDPGMSASAKRTQDKRKAELRMKKTHILAQEQARHEKLQKIFQKH